MVYMHVWKLIPPLSATLSIKEKWAGTEESLKRLFMFTPLYVDNPSLSNLLL